MPLFNYHCLIEGCGHEFERYIPHREVFVTCERCLGPVEKMASLPAMIPDEVPGGFTVENLNKTPTTFYSKSAYRDELRARGMRLRDHHLPTMEGSDKNPNCGRKWF